MIWQEHVAGSLNSNLEFFKMTLADFSDADMLVRPVPAANHTAWQIGHLIGSETQMVNAVAPGRMPTLPEGFAAKFTKETAPDDNPADFPNKAELLALFERQRAATVAWSKSLHDADLDRPMPDENMREFIPNVGALLAIIPNHVMMHMGQIQVIRRKLGKPVLF